MLPEIGAVVEHAASVVPIPSPCHMLHLAAETSTATTAYVLPCWIRKIITDLEHIGAVASKSYLAR